jgi:hypothetical protein
MILQLCNESLSTPKFSGFVALYSSLENNLIRDYQAVFYFPI